MNLLLQKIYIKKIIMTEKGSISIKISFLQDKKVVTKIKHVVMDVLILMCYKKQQKSLTNTFSLQRLVPRSPPSQNTDFCNRLQKLKLKTNSKYFQINLHQCESRKDMKYFYFYKRALTIIHEHYSRFKNIRNKENRQFYFF